MATTKKEKKAKQTQVVSDAQRKTLRTWNLRLAALLVIEAVAIVLIGGAQTVPVNTHYLATDTLASQANGHEVLALATRHLVDVRLAWIVAKFLLLFALVYLLAATLWRAKYEAWLERGVNKLRWVAFGLGGGAMAVALAMVSGVNDLPLLVLTFGLVVIAAMATLAAELLGPGRRLRRLVALIAIVAAILPWGVLMNKAAGAALFDGSLPGFVYYADVSMLLIFGATILAVYLRLKKQGKWAGAFYTERMFMFLGFLASSVLAWQIFAGALQP